MFKRRAGILLHPTSLPGSFGIGSLGKSAFKWIDFLEEAGQSLWQVMPLGPTGYGDSPYQCFSAFAGNPYLISISTLYEDGFLKEDDLRQKRLPDDYVDYGEVIPFKLEILRLAYKNFKKSANSKQLKDFSQFCHEQASWLDDYALFMAVKEAHGGQAWNTWPRAIRLREKAALKAWQEKLTGEIERQKVWQWFFFEQWHAVKSYANKKGIQIIGDIPIFVAYDSADTWSQADLFHLDDEGQATVIAGVPPDYFSETGQRWGNPLYRWDKMKVDGYRWWISRFKACLALVDVVRIDHFRGFEAYWEIPAKEKTAIKGKWVKGPGQAFFDAIKKALGDDLPIIAEDLGVITPEVEALRDDNGLPGMKILQFAFGSSATDPYLPHNFTQNCVVYTGTHDNDTTRSWYDNTSGKEQDFVRRYLADDGSNIAWKSLRLVNASVAHTAIVPLQDILNLGSEARMNTPGQAAGNWSWRFGWHQLPYWLAPQLKEIARTYGRVADADSQDEANVGLAVEAKAAVV